MTPDRGNDPAACGRCPAGDALEARTTNPYAQGTRPLPLIPWPTGQVQVIPPSLTEDDIRRIIREELGRVLEVARRVP